MNDWTDEDQAKAVEQRQHFAARFQRARREGDRFAMWCYDKLTALMLWVEREGKRLKRGF